ncbi:thioredoxin-disulfide reductase [Candidatus Daviesbacteria bacterium]|nr:thioredoxin-disulfide reductase [Candidatus Daviesbacteria bacterium]
MKHKTEKLVIIGSGPGGLTAAIYAARGGLNPLVVAGREAGGQLMLTTDVDDFPGFDQGIQGPELMSKMRKQAERFGTRFIQEDVETVNLENPPFIVKTENHELRTKLLIIATGASAMWLGLESEQRLIGRGISACAVCDALFFKNKNVIVVGGGDTAMRESYHLSKVCKKVTIVHRRGKLRAQEALQKLVKARSNVNFTYNKEIIEFIGQSKLEGVKLKDTQNGQTSNVPIDGVFVAIGHRPNTGFLKGQLDLDEKGYIIVEDGVKTSVAGVFVAGDVSDHKYRQAVTAAGAGCKAALEAEEYLEKLR